MKLLAEYRVIFALILIAAFTVVACRTAVPLPDDNAPAIRSLPNLRFGSINIHSHTGTYKIIAFREYDYSVTLFSEKADAKNVRVKAGIENGSVFYDKTLPYISANSSRRIEFSHKMIVGAHTMFVEVDPDNIIEEFNEADNRTTRTFIAEIRNFFW